MASTGQRGELTFLGIVLVPWLIFNGSKIMRKFAGVWPDPPPLGISTVNPQLQVGGGGKKLPPDLFAAISDGSGINKANALVTFLNMFWL